MSNTTSSNAWADMGGQRRNNQALRNLKITSGTNGAEQTFEVRFVGDPVTFSKYFINGRSAITNDPDNCVITKKFGLEAQTKHAVNLIFRKDQTLYFSELSASAINPVVAWAKRRKINPGGKVAVDFAITVRGTGKNTRYEVVALDASTLTPEEEAMQPYDLHKLFKATPEDEIEAKLFGGTNGVPAGKPPQQQQQAQPVASTATAASKPVTQDLPF